MRPLVAARARRHEPESLWGPPELELEKASDNTVGGEGHTNDEGEADKNKDGDNGRVTQKPGRDCRLRKEKDRQRKKTIEMSTLDSKLNALTQRYRFELFPRNQ